MSDRPSFKRNPAIHCWIKHITDSKYDENKNIFHTIFGKVKRIRIIGTIIKKTEEISEIDDFGFDGEDLETVRLTLIIDDGTNVIRGIIDNAIPENYRNFSVGDIVDVVGRLRKEQGNLLVLIEIIKLVEEPNYILLRDAEIINRIKSEDIQDINIAPDDEIDEISKEIDVDNIFEDDEF
ncbi:MAG: hypothetical protein ACFFDB_08365 [Promethearchaeota archaeon]